MEKFMTPDEAAEVMRVNVRFVYKLLVEGRLGAGRAGRRWLITETNIREFLAVGQRQSVQAGMDGVDAAGRAVPVRSGSPVSGQDGGVSSGSTPSAGSPGPGSGGSPLANKKNKRIRR